MSVIFVYGALCEYLFAGAECQREFARADLYQLAFAAAGYGDSGGKSIASYNRLMGYFEAFDHLMPGHNQPWLDKVLLPETLADVEKVSSGQAESEDIIDPWNRPLKQYSFGRFAITTRP